jgi:hypothetical protein
MPIELNHTISPGARTSATPDNHLMEILTPIA